MVARPLPQPPVWPTTNSISLADAPESGEAPWASIKMSGGEEWSPQDLSLRLGGRGGAAPEVHSWAVGTVSLQLVSSWLFLL